MVPMEGPKDSDCNVPDSDPVKQPRKASFLQTMVNSCVVLLGLGTFSSSYAMYKSGFFGVVVLVLVAGFYWFGSMLVYKCMEPDKSLKNYPDVAAKAFPKWGRLVVNTMFYIDILGSMVGYMVCIGDTLMHIFPHPHIKFLWYKGKTAFTCIAFFAILPTVWVRNLSYISYFTLWCPISILVTVVCLVVAGIKNHLGFDQKLAVLRLKNLPVTTGVFTFTFGATPVFATIYTSMENPSKFPQVLSLSFTTATLFNLVVGIIGSLMFGRVTKPQVHLSMPRNLVASKIAIWATLLIPVTQFALYLSPISCELEDAMIKLLSRRRPSKLTYAACILLRTVLLIGITLGAALFPYFANIIELLGSSFSVTLCVIFPCICYLKLFCRTLPRRHIVGLLAVVVISALAGAAGTVVSIQDLVHKTKMD